MNIWQRAVLPGAVGMLLSMSAVAQESTASDRPAPIGRPFELTMMRVFPYPDETYAPPGIAPVPACYRLRRCSDYDLYYFRDRPNRLTRLAPEAPADSAELLPLNEYFWLFVPVTPEENILPKYRTASQVRDEHRAVGRPIDGPH
jgi:hypothetical protein